MQLESEYKLGKAYRYFSCELVKATFYQNIDGEKCVMKCKVVPSHKMKSKQYDVWCILESDQPDKPGGKIYLLYCTCTAGNTWHISGALQEENTAMCPEKSIDCRH